MNSARRTGSQALAFLRRVVQFSTGITATGDLDAFIAVRPDCVA
ncbi:MULTISPECIES: hypothetical protein [Mycobacteriaceae]|uniref:Uncharacterized protein n=1 Tax=Mycolicibacterium parafortuitum TaxID=39692 RepID=A0ACC6MJS3_MYCPF|nr:MULTISPECIES: hypothetical protein [Mycobacteriaceae]MDZ5087175.1 hypothetical protein [Mycolicibacterium parafortuitum]